MPIYEYKCTECDNIFEKFFTQSELRHEKERFDGSTTIIEQLATCPMCGELAGRVVSNFSFNMNPGPISGIDDTNDLTLGKLVTEGKIPSEFKPTIKEIQDREKFRQMEKEYQYRVKKYDLDKPTKQEIDEAKDKSKVLEVIAK